MPKYITPEMISQEMGNSNAPFSSSQNQGNSMINNLDKVEKLLDKGMAIFERLQQMKQKKEAQESMSSQIEQKANKVIAMNQPAPQIIYKVPKITFKTDVLIEELGAKLDSLGEKYGERTLKSLLDDEIAQLRQSTFLKPVIEEILKKIVEVEEQ